MLSIIHVLRMDTPNLLFSEIKLRKQKNYDNKYSNWSLNSALKDYSPHSTENETIERYDQFYRDHKLLLVLFRVLAVMPIERSIPGRMTFSWNSAATLYAFIFWIFMTIIVLIVGQERINILYTTKQFDEYIYAVIFVIYLIPHFWIPFVGWGVATEVAEYKSSWGKFQLKFYRVTGTSLQFPRLKSTIVIISIGCILCAFLFLFALSFFLEGYPLWHTLAYYHIIITINMNCALWYINSRAIKTASIALAHCFQKEILSSYSADIFSKYRKLWINLSELLQSLGNAYARTYSTYCIFIFVNIVIAVYGAFAEIFDHTNISQDSYKEFGLVVDGLYCSILLFIFCDCSHNATLCVAEGIQNVLLKIDVRQINTKAKSEIDLFIFAIEMNPAIVSLKGYVNVNRELLTSFIATITVYLLVLMQFKFTLN
ncbi:gustatory and odorant receptor 22-like [Bactrocera oleae]|uniref:gustatory and odorant receptor 22-like n=1 Tax=Bactrocera oleae TaxID=104688 RepID=UPI00387E73C8